MAVPVLRRAFPRFVLVAAILPFTASALEIRGPAAPIPLLTPAAVAARPAQVPLAFEPAPRGAGPWRFAARGDGYLIGLAGHETLIVLREGAGRQRGQDAPAGRGARALRLRLEGAATDARWSTAAPQAGRIHRLIGNDPAAWEPGLQPVGEVRWHGIYPGIDAVYRGHGRQLQYDFYVAAGADPAQVRLRFDGARVVGVDEEGALQLQAGGRVLRQLRPVAWQDLPQGRQPVTAEYAVGADGAVGFALGGYDPEHPLVIDPILSYATFLGAAGNDQVWDIALADDSGALIVVGETESLRFPTNLFPQGGVLQTNWAGGVFSVGGDAFVARLNATGTAYEWFTYLGGSDFEAAYSVAVEESGVIVLGGFTTSTNFPVTAGAFQRTIGGLQPLPVVRYPLDGFVTRLAPDGSALLASTYLGGTGADQIIQLRLADNGDIVVAGQTGSTNLPVPAGAAQPRYGGGTNDAFVARLSRSLAEVVAATYHGGPASESAEGLALAADGSVLITGYTGSATNFPLVAPLQTTNAGAFDVMVARFNPLLTTRLFSTYLGGADSDYAYRIAMRPDGHVILGGETFSTNFPVTPDAFQTTNASRLDGFLTALAPDLTGLAWSTYYGGTGDDTVWSLAADAENRVLAALTTGSTNMAGVTTNAIQPRNGGNFDVLLARFTPGGQVEQATYYGGGGEEVPYALVLDAAGNAYVGGRTRSLNFTVTTNAAQVVYGGDRTDGFVFKVSFEPELAARLAGGVMEVSWPAPNPDWRLEQGTLPGETFAPVPELPEISQGRVRVTVPAAGGGAAFRLAPR